MHCIYNLEIHVHNSVSILMQERGMAKSTSREDAERCFDHHWVRMLPSPRFCITLTSDECHCMHVITCARWAVQEKQKSVPRMELATLGLFQSPARVTVFRSLHEQAFSSVSNQEKETNSA